MISKAETISPDLIDWIKIYVNEKHYPESKTGEILKETGGTFLLGGPIFLWNKNTSHPKLPAGPCCHLKADGEVLFAPDYNVPIGGPSWNTPNDFTFEQLPSIKQNYIQCVPLVRNGAPVVPLKINSDMAYPCPRQVIGIKEGRFAYLVFNSRLTPVAIQDLIVSYGWEFAELLDGGGSVVYTHRDGGAIRCDPGRVLYSYIVVKLKETAKPISSTNDVKRKIVLDTARKEIGIMETPAGSNLQKYGMWYKLNGAPWCMIFIQWVFAFSGLPLPIHTASCTEFAAYAKAHGQWVTKDFKPGDIALMRFRRNTTSMQHVGLIESVQSTYATTIEGNTSYNNQDNGGKVMRRHRSYGIIPGAYRPWYNM